MSACFKCKQLKETIDGKEKEIKSLKESVKTKEARIQALLKINQEILEPLVQKYMAPKVEEAKVETANVQ